MDSIAGFILAGGQSRRMGRDKSQLMIDGQSFVQRIAEKLAAVTNRITVVGSESLPTAITIELPVIPDIYPQWGALGGVHSALAGCSARWALIVACDFPLVTRQLFVQLSALREGVEAVAPVQSDGIPQPLCALYRVDPCLTVAELLIKSGERKPIALLQSVETRWVLFSELSSLEGADRFFDNINTPEDYARLSGKG